MQRIWNVKAKVIAVLRVVRASGTISKSLRKYLSNIPGKHKVKELQRKATLGTAPITMESANVKVRNNITCSKNCKYRTAATLYTLETRFV